MKSVVLVKIASGEDLECTIINSGKNCYGANDKSDPLMDGCAHWCARAEPKKIKF